MMRKATSNTIRTSVVSQMEQSRARMRQALLTFSRRARILYRRTTRSTTSRAVVRLQPHNKFKLRVWCSRLSNNLSLAASPSQCLPLRQTSTSLSVVILNLEKLKAKSIICLQRLMKKRCGMGNTQNRRNSRHARRLDSVGGRSIVINSSVSWTRRASTYPDQGWEKRHQTSKKSRFA